MYQQLVGSFVYLTLTRRDISFVVGVVSHYIQSLKKSNLEVAWCILRYVKGIIDYALLYKKGKECELVGYYNADFMSNKCRSTIGYILRLRFGANDTRESLVIRDCYELRETK